LSADYADFEENLSGNEQEYPPTKYTKKYEKEKENLSGKEQGIITTDYTNFTE
jgi:hypothetical protein